MENPKQFESISQEKSGCDPQIKIQLEVQLQTQDDLRDAGRTNRYFAFSGWIFLSMVYGVWFAQNHFFVWLGLDWVFAPIRYLINPIMPWHTTVFAQLFWIGALQMTLFLIAGRATVGVIRLLVRLTRCLIILVRPSTKTKPTGRSWYK